MSGWSPRWIVPGAVALVLALLRKYVPAPRPASANWKYSERQKPEPLPAGVIGAMMWGIGLVLLASFFLLRYANHRWAQMDGPADIRLYATPWLWGFFPGFAAVAVPWPLTLWILRRMGRSDEADMIADRSNSESGFNSYRVLKWFSLGVALPIGLCTLPAIPIHLSVLDSKVLVGHYGEWRPEVFPLDQAVRATLADTERDKTGQVRRGPDLFIDFRDGRRLDANAAGDGGTAADPVVVRLLLQKTGLKPQQAVPQ